MRLPRAFIILFLCLVASAAARAQPTAQPSAQPSAQEVIRLLDAGWTFTLPPGWERTPDGILQAQNEIVAARAPEKINAYILGIRRTDNPFVYALFQPFADPRMNSMSFDDIERVFSAAPLAKAQDRFKSSFADVIASSTFGQPQLDRDRKRIIITLSMTDPRGNTSRGVTQGLLFAGGMLNVHAYAPADQFEAKLPELLALADAVKFDPGQSFEPGSKKRRGVSAGVVGGVIGALVAVMYGAHRQRQLKKTASPQSVDATTPS